MKKSTTTPKKRTSGSKDGTGAGAAAGGAEGGQGGSRDWRGEVLARVRAIIRRADPAVVEEVKWRKPSNGMAGVPVWSHGGIVCTGETYKGVVKLTFAKGASLADPSGLFNSSLEGNTRRAIDIREGEAIDEAALAALVRAAVELNTAGREGGEPVGSRKRSKGG